MTCLLKVLTYYRLDSRQRKKQHTEKLEEEKKHYTTIISDQTEIIDELKHREAELVRERAELHAAQQDFQQYIATLHEQHEELITRHTQETSELRKKNAALMEHLQKLEATPATAPPSANAYSSEWTFEDFNNLSTNSPWDDFSDVNFSADTEPTQPEDLSMSILSNKPDAVKAKKSADGAFNLSAPWQMLLLFGALIALNSSSSNAHPSIPALSDEYRAESKNVLQTFMDSTGVSQSSSQGKTMAQKVVKLERRQAPPASTTTAPYGTISAAEMAQLSSPTHPPSALSALHDNLVRPSKQQEQEQLFGLSAEQYNSITSPDLDFLNNQQAQATRPNLQDMLSNMRGNGEKTAVHSRSLLWGQVSDKVVRDFENMVRSSRDVEQDGDDTMGS